MMSHMQNIQTSKSRSQAYIQITHTMRKGDNLTRILKESLHITSMTIVFFEINWLYSLGYRQTITKENILN